MRPAVYSLRAFKLALVVSRLLPRTIAHRLASALAQFIYRRQECARRALPENLAEVTG